MKSYHLFKLHPKSLKPYTPTKSAFNVAGCANWTVTAGRLQGASPNLTRLISVNNALTHYLLISIPPSFIGVLTYQSLDWITVLPEPSNRCQVHQGGITDASGPNYRASTSQAALAFLEENRVICERAQQGMTARFNRGGKLVALEQVLVDFRRHLLARHSNVTTPQLTVGANSRLFALIRVPPQLLLWSHWRRALPLNPPPDLKSTSLTYRCIGWIRLQMRRQPSFITTSACVFYLLHNQSAA